MRDYVSREDAIMVAGDMLNSLTGMSCKDGENTAREYFRSIPSTDIRENVRGEWRDAGEWEEIEVIAEAYDISGVKTWASKMKCDQCGFTTIAIEGHFSQYNFCPNCGADMRGRAYE